jgi:quinol monooxygenase YgiN/mannose-6-phosphate isomerase-like protein (cupin superfamily)
VASVGRYVKLSARLGRGDELAEEMLRVAERLSGAPGCELYLINRAPAEPDVIWVTEIWSSQEQLEQTLDSDAARERIAQIRELLDGPVERIDVEPLGGAGYPTGPAQPAGGTGATRINLEEVEDQAPKFGYGEIGEARFARTPLATRHIGISHQRLRPGRRQAFGHRHEGAEEVYVVLSGSGLVKVDDEVIEIGPLDAIRVAPRSMRAFEAGPDGLELLAVGQHHPGDTEIDPGFWPAGG